MNKVELFEDERAQSYNQFVEVWIPNYHYFINCLPKLLRETNPKKILVAGCGTGNEIERLVKAPENWEITGVDPSPDMIKQAEEILQNYDNVTLVRGLVSDISLEKKYNAAMLLLVLHFFEDNGDKLHLLKAIADRLVSGAKLVMLDITGDKKQINQNLKILKSLLPNHLSEEEINHRLHRIEKELYSVSEERISELFQEAGFEQPLRFFQSSIYMGWLAKKK